MDKILAPIKGRIIQLLDYKGVDKIKFFEKNQLSASNFRSKSLYSEVGGDVIAKISSLFPDLNLNWLVTGEGEMCMSVQNLNRQNSKQTSKALDFKDKYIEILEENRILVKENHQLKEELMELRHQYEGNERSDTKVDASIKDVKSANA